MGWIPDKPSDAFWFAVAPITAGPTLVYASAGYVTGDYPLGKPDWRANIRNSVLWVGAAGAAYGWNLAMSPHNAVWMTGSNAYKTMFHIAGVSWILPATLVLVATASAAGYVATSDVHLGATGMLLGDMNMSVPVGKDEGGSSTNIFPGLSDHGLWPWNW